ncbi:SGNH/GDSL hydrolase family protein [Paenibacillus lupini]|uniref:SGNH/GDSL hydrolase family protein n=1 Tax=Paenibacillus lupini TaxID=1450204 RepID=UPI0014215E6C|nr:SGNH/GDSL hydrolase family protein [Paenibacillus lupini]NIK26253.1 lysophospholipase L1-like esterase [Paenibacillus lupini]
MNIVVMGDSITEGLGVKRSGKTYANLLQDKLLTVYSKPFEIINLGSSAMQIDESRIRYEEQILGQVNVKVVIIAHGITEAIVRPKKEQLKYLPRRWRKPGWTDPRPYYSRKFLRRMFEMLESGIRWRTKAFLIRLFGGEKWMPIDQFAKHLSDCTRMLLNDNRDLHVIYLSPIDIEEKYFPHSKESLKQYKEQLNEICGRLGSRVHLCDASLSLHRWSDYFEDRFHPNEQGHEKIADALLRTIMENSIYVELDEMTDRFAERF